MAVRIPRLIALIVCLSFLGVSLADAQLQPEVRDRTVAAAVQIALDVVASDEHELRAITVPVGSGTIVSPDGLILTNWHVVDVASNREVVDSWHDMAFDEGYNVEFELNEDRFVVLLSDGIHAPKARYYAKTSASDIDLDLAVLHITGPFPDTAPVDYGQIPFAPLGDSDGLRIGDPISVLSYPLIGGDALTFTAGVVSGFNAEEGVGDQAWITTDASTSGGSSGGTAVDSQGRLIGVPTQAPFLDCRPGDSNGDGKMTAEDVGCVPTGGSIAQLRPVNLTRSLLIKAGWKAPNESSAAELANSGSQTEAAENGQTAPGLAQSTNQVDVVDSPVPTLVPSPNEHDDDSDANSEVSSNVPMYRSNTSRTGEMPGPDPEGIVGVLWEFDSKFESLSQPTLVDGVLYFSAASFKVPNGAVIAVDAMTGREIWRRSLEPFWSSPMVVDREVYAAGAYGSIYVLNAKDGSTIRSMRFTSDAGCAATTSPLVLDDSVVSIFACYTDDDITNDRPWYALDGYLVSFDRKSGGEKWHLKIAGFSPTVSPAYANGLVVVADAHGDDGDLGTVYAAEIQSGSELWRFESNEPFLSTPIIANDMVFIAGLDGTLYALDQATGLERWRFDAGETLGPDPALIDDLIYVGDWVGHSLFQLNSRTGEVVWKTTGANSDQPITVTKHFVYVSNSCGSVIAYDRSTRLQQSYRASRHCSNLTSPVVSNGVIYAGDDEGVAFAMGDMRASVPIDKGMTIEIIAAGTQLRAAPSSAAVVRGEFSVGDKAKVTGESEQREGDVWWPVESQELGNGWVPESAVIAAEIPATPTPSPRPTGTTAAPSPTPTHGANKSDATDCQGPDYPESGTLVETTQTTSLRALPGHTSDLLRTLSTGTELDVLDDAFGQTADTCDWIPVRVVDSAQVGFVEVRQLRRPSINASSNSSESQSSQVSAKVFHPTHQVKTSQSINFRSGPSTTSSIIVAISPFTLLEFLGVSAPSSDANTQLTWMKFRLADGREGWLYAEDVEPIESTFGGIESPLPPMSAAMATVATYATREPALATAAAELAAVATANAQSGANDLATARAEAAARATDVAGLQAQQVDAQVTATALAVVAANSVLDPTRQSIVIQTDLGGMLAGDEDALTAARRSLETALSRYPLGSCRAGFVLISGKAPDIDQGITLAERTSALLRDSFPDIFSDATGEELFALPNDQPFGEVGIDIFFYSGCQPIG